jgi:formate dehydrogenase subunit gamma
MSEAMSKGHTHGPKSAAFNDIRTERQFKRFTLGQRWEHGILILSFTILLLTGLPQKYFSSWGFRILTSPERLEFVRQVHHYTAIVLTLEVVYHLGRGFYQLARRQLPSSIFPNMQDLRDAWQMVKYLFYFSEERPAFGKYNFEQKFTYWFLFLGIGIMVVTGFILWFPILWTRIFPGGIIPAAQLAHSSEAIAAGLFIVIWHFYHVHFERLNISIFTGRLNEHDMKEYHMREYQRITGEHPEETPEKKPQEDDDPSGGV